MHTRVVTSSKAAYPAVDQAFEALVADGAIPGLAYGVIVDGRLVDAHGFGTLRVGATPRPDADSVFRIASMTKSFTAAAILLLRDEGVLRLDDPAARWVPDLAADGDRGDGDDRPVTIEQLLTMSSGLPTDDPWGDRQQGQDLGRFAELLRGGVRSAWVPGTRFEYSNLGYGILGRVISAASGLEYRDFVTHRFLEPLGMDATTFSREDVTDERLALGYVKRRGTWLEEPIDGYGALASMGGVFTTIRDLARWVAGFTDSFGPSAGASGHPLSPATRREMQQTHRTMDTEIEWSTMTAHPTVVAGGYGYGLFVFEDQVIGQTVGHGGGYPGFGSHMRWHAPSGVGVIAFGNARYARLGPPVLAAVRSLVTAGQGRASPVRPWPETVAARSTVDRLLDRWDDGIANDLFAMNIDLDEPLELRRAEMERLRSIHGRLVPDTTEGLESDAPSHLAWWMRGERGRVRVAILLDPELPPRVQALELTSVPEPPDALLEMASRLVALCDSPGPTWPDDIRLAGTLDPEALGRDLRATEALYGPLTLGTVTRGDGERMARWRARGSRGEIDLELSHDVATGELTMVLWRPRPIRMPIHVGSPDR